MALIFFDGFDSFGTTPGSAPVGLGNKWSETGGHTGDLIQTGRFSDGHALRPGFNSSGTNGTVTPVFAATQTLVAGVAFKIESLPSSGQFRDLLVFDSSSGGEVGVAVNSSGGLRVFRLSNGNNIEESATGLIDPNKWYYLEMKVTIANSGSYEVHLDGVNVVDGTGDTQQTNPFADRVRLVGRSTSSGNTVWPIYDDFYVLDTTGAANNDFLGPRHIVTIFPTATGDNAEFTPASGDNYTNVDDNGHDSDTTYVESSTAGNKDLYNFGNVGTLTGINAVQVNGICKKTDTTAFDFIAVVKSATTEQDGTNVLVDTTNYIAAWGIFDIDPNTSAAWTDSGINSAQFGFKVG